MPNRRQAITWANADSVHWCIYAALGGDEFMTTAEQHDDVIKWKHFPRYWPFVRGIHRSTVNSPHKGQWRGALMFSLMCARINSWVNNREAGDLRRYRHHYDVILMRYYSKGLRCGVLFLTYVYVRLVTSFRNLCLVCEELHICESEPKLS